MSARLSVQDLESGYGGGVRIVNGVSATFDEGTVTTVIGPNGAGKSTLLKSIYGTATRYQGEVELDGVRVTQAVPWKRLRSGLGVVFQGRVNFPKMTVAENLDLGRWVVPRHRHKEVREAVMDRYPILGQKSHQIAGNLSGGEQQILEMAMVLQAEPRVLMLDEPSLGLSPKWQSDVFKDVRRIADSGVCVIVVEQNVPAALAVSDRAVVMQQGLIALDGPAADLTEDPRLRQIYMGGDYDAALPASTEGNSA